eukprot:scaffold598_cov57-Cylindrotheca_fusiformis.AAC.1
MTNCQFQTQNSKHRNNPIPADTNSSKSHHNSLAAFVKATPAYTLTLADERKMEALGSSKKKDDRRNEKATCGKQDREGSQHAPLEERRNKAFKANVWNGKAIPS